MIEKYDITLYKSENSDILKYCYENYAHNVYVKEFIERMTIALEENNDMHESIDNFDSVDLIEIYLPLTNMMLAIFMAMMPILIMLMEMNLLHFLMLNMKLLILHPHLIVPSMKSMIAMML